MSFETFIETENSCTQQLIISDKMLISKIILARFFAIADTWQPNFIHVMMRSRKF